MFGKSPAAAVYHPRSSQHTNAVTLGVRQMGFGPSAIRLVNVYIGCLSHLWPYDCSVEHPVISPALEVDPVGIFGSGGFIDVNAQAGLVVGIHVPFLDNGTAGQDLLGRFRKHGLFQDAKVWRHKIQMQVVTMADRIYVVGAMPRGTYAEELAHVGHFSGHVNATYR